MYPVFVCIPDNGFRCGADNEFLFEFCFGIYYQTVSFGIVFQPVVSYYGTLFGKTFHMFGLPAHKGLGNKKREIGIHMACFFKHFVELLLHFFPNCITVGFYHHATPDS